ncbi:MAG TPA: NAD(P)-dependent oxidoreductase, partial [Aggregatilineales bacterium]|nr:NAD(P)-dependent oxidoreductase [Aggregatilineales bacterium]
MKVLITGGAGHIGKATTERFIKHGWEVRVIGLEDGIEVSGAEFVRCDILDYDDLRQQVSGCQAIVHLAAIRGPQLAPGHEVFEVNVAGTFNVFEAAAAEGIRRVVQASSINAFGCAYSLIDIAPKYLPIDEDHPVFTTDPYSYSKEIIEDIGRYYWRRGGISSVALRFPGVYNRDHLQTEKYRQYRERSRVLLDEIMVLPEAERQARLDSARQHTVEWRRQRPLEFKDRPPEPLNRHSGDDPLWLVYGFDRFNFWASLDVRDAAQSIEKGVMASYEGAHALFVNDSHNSLGYDSKCLVRL